MMMNDRVEIGTGAGPVVRDVGSFGRASGGTGDIDEKLVGLHRMLKRIAKARAHLDLQEAAALREAQQLRLWRQFGHTSLADYMVQELGYSSHRVAEERLRLANALPALPEMSKAIENGEINFSKARELVRVVTPKTEQAWLGKAKGMNVREVEQAVAGHAKGDLPEDPVDARLVRRTIWLSVRPETEVLFREARRAIDKERGQKLDEDAALEALCRAYLSGGRGRADRVSAADDAARGEPCPVPRGSDRPSSAGGGDQRSASAHGDQRSAFGGSGCRSFVGDPGDPSMQLTIFEIGQSIHDDADDGSRVSGRAPVDDAAPGREHAVGRASGELVSCDRSGEGTSKLVNAGSSESVVGVGRCELVLCGGSSELGSSASSELVVRNGASELAVGNGTSEIVVSGAAPYRIAVTICSHCGRGWQHGGGAVEEMTLAAVGRARCDAQWIGDVGSDEVERARQEISPATRRKVLHRDQGR